MTDGVEETIPPAPVAGVAHPIVCFSHLGWDSALFQRPQQIMSRLAAAGHPVYYFACVGRRRHKAQPMAGPVAGAPGVEVYTIPYAPGVTRFAGVRRWAAGLQIAGILARRGVHSPILWFYHPSLFALGYSHADSAIVYDVMDHFPSFESSIDDAYFDELTLLAEADVVFTGGRSLDRHARQMLDVLAAEPGGDAPAGKRAIADRSKPTAPVHCFPSGVDLDHFAKAYVADDTGQATADADTGFMGNMPRPRFGYFGAIDERIDWDIIRGLGAATSGSVILAGPALRDVPADLPLNVHLPGPVEYGQLPQLLKQFDVCLIPFRNTTLVQFVSPTKTPEYLAGGRPVVSTPIPDVVSDYGDVVRISATPENFVAASMELSAAPPEAAMLAGEARRRARTWDQIAAEMGSILNKIIATKAPV